MNPEAMAPQGRALLDYFHGDQDAELLIRRDDGYEEVVPMRQSFRPPGEFSRVEMAAIEQCRGRVLDIGAGSGLHSLVLQFRGLAVTALDLSPEAVEVMLARGVKRVHCGDILDYQEGPFDTLLTLGFAIGMVETLAGLDQFLEHADGLVGSNGQLLVQSRDPESTDELAHHRYHELNRKKARYIGEVGIELVYRGASGAKCGWLHVDPETLAARADREGWGCRLLVEEESGEYLARLTPTRAA